MRTVTPNTIYTADAPIPYIDLTAQVCPEHCTQAEQAVTGFDLERRQRTFRVTFDCGCVLAGDVATGAGQ